MPPVSGIPDTNVQSAVPELWSGSEVAFTAPKQHILQKWSIPFRAALAVLVTLCLLEAGARVLVVAGHPGRAKAPEFERKVALARMPVATGQPLIFIGGSFTEHAIFPELLQKRLGDKGIQVYPKNLAVRKSCLLEHKAMLDIALKACTTQPVVFYDLRQEAFRKSFIAHDGQTAEFLQTYAGRHLYPPTALQDKVSQFFADNFCLVRDRAFLRQAAMNFFSTVFCFEHNYQNEFEKSYDFAALETSNMGTATSYVVMNDRKFVRDTASQAVKFLWNKNIGDEWCLDWFVPIKERCAEVKAPLVLLWLPECTVYFNSKARDEELRTRFSQLADNKSVFFIDLHDIDQLPEHFRDRCHTNTIGAIYTTEALAAKLQQPEFRGLLNQNRDPNDSSTAPARAD